MEIIEQNRALKTEQPLACGECGGVATHSCTDARQLGETWLESAERYGCAMHPVESMIYFADGHVITAKEYERQAHVAG